MRRILRKVKRGASKIGAGLRNLLGGRVGSGRNESQVERLRRLKAENERRQAERLAGQRDESVVEMLRAKGDEKKPSEFEKMEWPGMAFEVVRLRQEGTNLSGAALIREAQRRNDFNRVMAKLVDGGVAPEEARGRARKTVRLLDHSRGQTGAKTILKLAKQIQGLMREEGLSLEDAHRKAVEVFDLAIEKPRLKKRP